MPKINESDIQAVKNILGREDYLDGILNKCIESGKAEVPIIPFARQGTNARGIEFSIKILGGEEENAPVNLELEAELIKDIAAFKEVLSSGLDTVVADAYPDWFEITSGYRPCVYLKRFSRPGLDNIKEIKRSFINLGFNVTLVTVSALNQKKLGYKRNEYAIVFRNNSHIFSYASR